MAKIKEIECSLYKKEITIFIGSYDEMLEWASKRITNPAYEDLLKGMKESSPGGQADCHYDKSYCIVRLPCFPQTPEEISWATHELLHAVFFIMETCGVDFDWYGPNEAYTYLLEWLTKATLEKKGYVTVKNKAKHTKH